MIRARSAPAVRAGALSIEPRLDRVERPRARRGPKSSNDTRAVPNDAAYENGAFAVLSRVRRRRGSPATEVRASTQSSSGRAIREALAVLRNGAKAPTPVGRLLHGVEKAAALLSEYNAGARRPQLDAPRVRQINPDIRSSPS